MKRILVPALFLSACSSSPGNESSGNLFLSAVADDIALPTLGALVQTSETLATKLQAVCSNPGDAELLAAEAAWRAARLPLKRAEAFSFGPADTLRLEAALDYWPARPEALEARRTATATLSAEALLEAPATEKGLPAIEYLLFDPLGDRAAVQQRLTEGSGQGCAYLVALGQRYLEDTRRLEAAWAPGGGNYRIQLVDPGVGADPYFADSRAAISAVVNQMIGTLGAVESAKLAKPLGRQDGGVVQLASLESRASGNSVADLLGSLEGVKRIYEARPAVGPSLSDFVGSRSPSADEDFRSGLEALEASLRGLDASLETKILNAPEQVEAVFLQAQATHRQLAGPVAGALGVTVNFSDADGD